ncbi:hypothetical protein LCL97_22510 [Seohaeicola saemankumensis]|nr:hypothetical protein [Seohaeicola saemankumensis]MCA0873615.1 hypothetical protein [Seohaeicola saemankumensis]
MYLRALFHGIPGLFFWLFSACSIQIAPSYDQAIYDKILASHEQALVLFSGLSGCPSGCAFSTHAARYDAVIAGYTVALTRAQARPTPALGVRLAKSEALEKVCKNSTPEQCLNTVPEHLELVIGSLSDLRDTHRHGTLSQDEVAFYRNEYTKDARATLTIEGALKR